MKMINPFQINDWEIKKFLKVVLAIQLAIWGVIGLDVIGLQIPILRQLIGFIYLTLKREQFNLGRIGTKNTIEVLRFLTSKPYLSFGLTVSENKIKMLEEGIVGRGERIWLI